MPMTQPPADPASVEPAAPQHRTAALSHRKPTRLVWTPGPVARAELARGLDLIGISALDFTGELRPAGRSDFVLEGRLAARLTQACVVTLAPVPAQVEEPVLRRYIADWVEPEGDEVEIPEDDSSEAMPEVLDLAEVVREALALALPPYPRAPGAELGEAVFAPPQAAPLREADLRPFAGLAGLLGAQEDGAGQEDRISPGDGGKGETPAG